MRDFTVEQVENLEHPAAAVGAFAATPPLAPEDSYMGRQRLLPKARVAAVETADLFLVDPKDSPIAFARDNEEDGQATEQQRRENRDE